MRSDAHVVSDPDLKEMLLDAFARRCMQHAAQPVFHMAPLPPAAPGGGWGWPGLHAPQPAVPMAAPVAAEQVGVVAEQDGGVPPEHPPQLRALRVVAHVGQQLELLGPPAMLPPQP